MKVQICYPLPLESEDAWKRFKPHVEEFIGTWLTFPPGVRCQLWVMGCKADVPSEIQNMFSDLPAVFCRYDGDGMDLGCQQYLAQISDDDVFQVNCTSRMFFHRSGWLNRLVCERNNHGPGFYGMTASREGRDTPYICTRGHCYDVGDFKLYPHNITSRDQGVFVELGDGCLTDWFNSIGRESYVVTWSNCFGTQDGIAEPNTFRMGDQSEVLCWDKHTKAFALADDTEKERLFDMMLIGYDSAKDAAKAVDLSSPTE